MSDSSSSEEDYMSLKFEAQSQPVQSYEKKRIRTLNEQLSKNKKSKKELEIEEQLQLQTNLKTSIPDTNKGFQMLQKMGFKPNLDIEPIEIVLKNNRKGLGLNEPKPISKKPIMTENELKQYNLDKRKVYNQKQYSRDVKKMRQEIINLDEKNGIESNPYWPVIKSKSHDIDGKNYVELEGFEVLDVFDQMVLCNNYLRDVYFYCSFCGLKFKDSEDLNGNCPGDEHEDHDD
jgi:hypothetical protein